MVGSIAAVLLTAFFALAVAHGTPARNTLRAEGTFPSYSASNQSNLPPSKRDRIGENSVGKISPACVSGGKRCDMSPEEFARFYPPLFDWIQTTLTASSSMAQTVASRGFSRLPLYFTQETLTTTKVVLVDPLPMPPLSSMGLTRFANFERGNFDGITYMDKFF